MPKKYKEAERFLDTEEEVGSSFLVEFYLATERYGEAVKLIQGMTLKKNMDVAFRMRFHTQYGLALRGKGMLLEASSELLKAVSIEGSGIKRLLFRRGYKGKGTPYFHRPQRYANLLGEDVSPYIRTK